ncbi:unnamed protein product, partial [marine sediment metagenome]
TREEIEKTIRETELRVRELETIGKNSEYFQELSDLALLQLEIGYYTESEKNIFVCLKHFKKQKDKLGQAAVYGILGVIYFKSEQYQKSIQYYNLAYEIYDKFHQIQEQITCLIGIGNNFIKLNQFDEACEIFLECSAICSDNKDIYNLLDCLGNLITLYEKQENWDIVYELSFFFIIPRLK